MHRWILAARLRTLPLSISGIILGSLLAYNRGFFDMRIFIFAIITTILLQILSNYANDLGDFLKGSDTNKIGEKRTLASGLISIQEMKKALMILTLFSLLSISTLIYIAFGFTQNLFLFMGLGVLAILSAIFYTMGKKAYGYIGLGDLSVFLFFGLLSVLGTEFLYTQSFNIQSLLPAASIGFFSTAVLNLNNLRDFENDKKTHKKTFAHILGKKNARIYLLALLYLPFAFTLIYVLNFFPQNVYAMSFLLLLIPSTKIRRSIIEIETEKEYDPFLKKTAMLTFAFSIILGLGINNFFIQ